jgi:very-short-patch-repair endonuclease
VDPHPLSLSRDAGEGCPDRGRDRVRVERKNTVPYPHYIIDIARRLRKNPTPAEALLWEHLRNRRLGGLKFVRQHPFGNYVADFYCAELKLVVETEGGVHDQPGQREYDDKRMEELGSRGLQILRFSNEEVLERTAQVLEKILAVKRSRSRE